MAINPNLNTVFSMRKERARQAAQGSPSRKVYPEGSRKSINQGSSGRLYRTITPSRMSSTQAPAVPAHPVQLPGQVFGPYAGPQYTPGPVNVYPVKGPYAGPQPSGPGVPHRVFGPMAGPPNAQYPPEPQSVTAPQVPQQVDVPHRVFGPLAGPPGMMTATAPAIPQSAAQPPAGPRPTGPPAIEQRPNPFGGLIPISEFSSGPVLTADEEAAVRQRARALMAPILESLGGMPGERYEGQFKDLTRQATGARVGTGLTQDVIDQVNQTDQLGYQVGPAGSTYETGIAGGSRRGRIPMTDERLALAARLQREIEDRAEMRRQGLDPEFPQATENFGVVNPVSQRLRPTADEVAANVQAREQELERRRLNVQMNAMGDAEARRARMSGQTGPTSFMAQLASVDPQAAARYGLGLAALQNEAQRLQAAGREAGLDRELRRETANREFELQSAALANEKLERERQFAMQAQQGQISKQQFEAQMARSDRQHQLQMQELKNANAERTQNVEMAKSEIERQEKEKRMQFGDQNAARLRGMSGPELLYEGSGLLSTAVSRAGASLDKNGLLSDQDAEKVRLELDRQGITPDILADIEQQHRRDVEQSGVLGGGLTMMPNDSTAAKRAQRGQFISIAHQSLMGSKYTSPREPGSWSRAARTSTNLLPPLLVPKILKATMMPDFNYLPF